MAWIPIKIRWLKISIITIILSSLIVFLQLAYVANVKNTIESINRNKFNFLYREYFLSYYEHKFHFPENLDSLKSFFPHWDVNRNFTDPFSDNSLILGYIPIIEKNNQIDGYILYSSGPDGVLNNLSKSIKFNEIKYLKWYNKDFRDVLNSYIPDELFRTNFSHKYFGRKDYGILIVNGPAYIKSQVKRKLTTIDLINEALENNLTSKGKILKSYYWFNFIPSSIINTEEDFLILEGFNNEYKIKCEIPINRYNKERYFLNKELSIIGLLTKIDTINHTIILTNCLIENYNFIY